MKLIPDGYGNYKHIDLHVGDIIPDGFGEYKFYNSEEDNKNIKCITNYKSCSNIYR